MEETSADIFGCLVLEVCDQAGDARTRSRVREQKTKAVSDRFKANDYVLKYY